MLFSLLIRHNPEEEEERLRGHQVKMWTERKRNMIGSDGLQQLPGAAILVVCDVESMRLQEAHTKTAYRRWPDHTQSFGPLSEPRAAVT